MPAAAAGAQVIGSFLQSNEQKNAAKANLAQQSSLDTQIENIYGGLMKTFHNLMGATNPAGSLETAKNFYQSEVQGGLSPAVTGAAESQFQQQNALNLSTLKNQMSPYTPNKAGLISNFQNNEILGNVSLQQQLAAMNQGVRQQGAQGLTGIADSVLGFGSTVGGNAANAFGALASQFGQANMFNAAGATNPFSSIASFLASNPNLFGGGGGTPSAPPGVSGPYTGSAQYSGGPQPGQGGAGAVGGTGTSGFG